MEFFTYDIMKYVWWLLVGALLIGFTIMDGHDMGVGSLLPFVARTDDERRVAINTVAPHWDGNQVWFLTAGGAIFASWPFVYATAFSGLYWGLLLVLFALFFRPVGFDYRSKVHNKTWRSLWDWGLFIGSFVPPLVCGVAFGNLFQGLPFTINSSGTSTYLGTQAINYLGTAPLPVDQVHAMAQAGNGFTNLLLLLNPFALVCGLAAICLVMFHGTVYLMVRTEGRIHERCRTWNMVLAVIVAILFTVAGLWLAYAPDFLGNMHAYVIKNAADLAGVTAPGVLRSTQEVVRAGTWMHNYVNYPWFAIFPVLGYLGVVVAMLLARAGKAFAAFWASALAIFGVIMTAGTSLFPFVLPSNIDPDSSLTMFNATASHITLSVMLVATVIFLPIVLTYTRWAYKTMRRNPKKAEDFTGANDHFYY